MFKNCEKLKELDISNFKTDNVKNMNSMFYNCISLEKLTLSEIKTEKVKDMSFMFKNCKSLKRKGKYYDNYKEENTCAQCSLSG